MVDDFQLWWRMKVQRFVGRSFQRRFAVVDTGGSAGELEMSIDRGLREAEPGRRSG